jgi:hypothetical protein
MNMERIQKMETLKELHDVCGGEWRTLEIIAKNFTVHILVLTLGRVK